MMNSRVHSLGIFLKLLFYILVGITIKVARFSARGDLAEKKFNLNLLTFLNINVKIKVLFSAEVE